MSAQQSQSHVRGILIVVAGVLLISFDVLLVRLAGVDGWNVSFWRGVFMSLAMAPFCLIGLLRAGGKPENIRGVLLAALMMALSSLGLVLAFTLTRAANAVVILSAAPLFAALFSRWFLGERCPLRTWLAILVCMAGVVWVMRGSIGGGDLVGDLLAVVATVFVGGYFTVFRRYPKLSRSAVIVSGGLMMALISLPLATPFVLSTVSYGWLALAGFIQMPIAMLLITVGTRFLPATEVSLFLLLETILAPIWVWMVFAEVPPEATLAGGVLILLTLIVHTVVGVMMREE
ncbi:MAG: DMT family transporter [Desulfuromonadales bacterium]|nr:DMT family transporter [Desulfuromonadales bacterium]